MPEYVVESQDRVITTGESPFSVARDVLGPDATESQVAAFAQAQGWDSGFQSGQTISIRGTYVAEGATPSSAYMAQVRGEADAYNAGTFNPYSSAPAGSQTASYFGGAADPSAPGYQPFSAGLAGGQQPPLPGSGVKSRANTPQNLAANTSYAPSQFSPGAQQAGQIQGGPIADIGGNAERFGGPNTGPVIPAMNAQQTGLFNQIEAGLPTGALPNINRPLDPAFQAPQRPASTPRPTGGGKAAPDTIGVQQPQNVTASQAQAANYTAIALQEALTAEAQGFALEAQQYFPNYVLDSTREIMGVSPAQMSSIGYVMSGNAWVPDPAALITTGATMPTGTVAGGGQSQSYVDWWNYPATGVYPAWMAPNRPRRGGVGFGGNPSFAAAPPAAGTSYGGGITAGWSVNF